MLSHNKYYKAFIDTIFPIKCIRCQKDDVWICQDCSQKILQNTIHYCLLCKRQTRLGEFCPNCAHLFHLNKVWIAGDFQNQYLSQLIKTYKYKYAQDISDFLGLFLLDFLKKQVLAQDKKLLTKDIIIIPVPLHPKRLRWRGFNQSELIADIVSTSLRIPINKFGLKRIKFKKPQAKLKKEERTKNIRENFDWHGNNLEQQKIILIDDVTTTGATLNECAKVLKANGAKKVWGLVLANG